MISKTNELVKRVRLQNRLSQEEMAQQLGVTSNYISLIENNRKNAGLSFLKKVSTKYNIPLILLAKGAMIPQGKSKREKEVREKLITFIDDLERAFLHA